MKESILFLLLSFFLLISNRNFSLTFSPYFLEDGKVIFDTENDTLLFDEYHLNIFSFDVFYGVNRNLLLGFKIPYLFFETLISDGIIGDASFSAKFLMERDFLDKWNFAFITHFRFPTGVIKEDSYRYIAGKTLSFYPFSTGTFSFSPAFLISYYLKPFMLWANLTYHSENTRDETLLSFNNSFDWIEANISFDFLCDYNFSNFFELYYIPQLSIAYRYNLSPLNLLPDGFYIKIRNLIKVCKTFRFNISVGFPINQNKSIFKFDILVGIGLEF